MALEKTTVAPDTGAPVQYWRVVGINIDLQNKAVSVSYVGYLNKASRDASLSPLVVGHVTVQASQVPDINTVTVAQAYGALKALVPALQDAKDV